MYVYAVFTDEGHLGLYKDAKGARKDALETINDLGFLHELDENIKILEEWDEVSDLQFEIDSGEGEPGNLYVYRKEL